MTPVEALDKAIHVTNARLRGVGAHCMPGEAISFCSFTVREALKYLSSDDIKDVRLEDWMTS